MDSEQGSQPSHQPEVEEQLQEPGQLSNWVLFGYKVLILATYILAIGHQYGAFTDGLPPTIFRFVYWTGALYELYGRFRLSRIILWDYTQVLEGITLDNTARFLHRYNLCFWIVFFMFLYFLVDIARYHQPRYLSL